MALSDYDITAGNNTAISGTDISEGCAPGNINDAIRQLMADIATDGLWRQNIIDTVAETSGVPTGGVFEEGSGANGNYLRLASGLQVCWKSHTDTLAIGTTTGGLGHFQSTTSTWTFPAAFIAAPVVMAATDAAALGVVTSSVTTSTANFRWTAVATQSSAARRAYAVALGLWFS